MRKKQGRILPVLGSFSATAISIGGMIGSGIFFIIGFATGATGASVVLALVLAGIIAMFTALSFASLGSKITKQGGEYQFVYIALGPKIGFVGGLIWIGTTMIAAVLVSIAFASYFVTLFPIASVNVVASLACLVFVFVDMIGIKISSITNNVLSTAKVGVLIFFILIGLPYVKLSNFQPLFTNGITGLLSATFLIFFAYAGFGKITAASEEVKIAKKNVPKAIITAVSVCSILYLLAGIIAVGVVGPADLSSAAYRNAPFAQIMLRTGFSPAFFMVTLGVLAATASVLLIQMLGLSRTVYAMSLNKQLPAFLGELHPRFGTPYFAEMILGVMIAIGAFFFRAGMVITLTSMGILGYYALINIAAFQIKRKERMPYRSCLIQILGFASSVLLIAYFLVSKLIV